MNERYIEGLSGIQGFTHKLLGWDNSLVAVPPLDYSHFVDVVLACVDMVTAIRGAVVLGGKRVRVSKRGNG